MEEANHHLEYRSQNPGAAHMCGHDGHMACLLAGVDVISRSLDRIPSNKVIRLLFQPAEEIRSGAKKMIEEGCLKELMKCMVCIICPICHFEQSIAQITQSWHSK